MWAFGFVGCILFHGLTILEWENLYPIYYIHLLKSPNRLDPNSWSNSSTLGPQSLAFKIASRCGSWFMTLAPTPDLVLRQSSVSAHQRAQHMLRAAKVCHEHTRIVQDVGSPSHALCVFRFNSKCVFLCFLFFFFFSCSFFFQLKLNAIEFWTKSTLITSLVLNSIYSMFDVSFLLPLFPFLVPSFLLLFFQFSFLFYVPLFLSFLDRQSVPI